MNEYQIPDIYYDELCSLICNAVENQRLNKLINSDADIKTYYDKYANNSIESKIELNSDSNSNNLTEMML